MLGSGGHGALQVGQRDWRNVGRVSGRRIVDRASRVRVLGRNRLGVHGAGGIDTAGTGAGCPRGRVSAALDDGFGGSVVGTFRVGEAGGVEAMLDQVLAVVADLLDLGGVVRRRLEVDVVDRVAADLVTPVVQGSQLGPGHVLGVDLVQ